LFDLEDRRRRLQVIKHIFNDVFLDDGPATTAKKTAQEIICEALQFLLCIHRRDVIFSYFALNIDAETMLQWLPKEQLALVLTSMLSKSSK
jgi:hypothetical protein